MEIGAGNEIRTRDPNLGKVVLYQLSYSRSSSRGFASSTAAYSTDSAGGVNTFFSSFCFYGNCEQTLANSTAIVISGQPIRTVTCAMVYRPLIFQNP